MVGDTVELAGDPDTTPWRLRSSRYRDSLELEPEPGTVPPYWLSLKGWHRTGGADPAAIDPDLGPAALPTSGVYRRTFPQDELLRAGIAPGQELNYGGTVELWFSDGAVDAHWVDDDIVDPFSVRVDGDLIRFDWPEGGVAFSVSSSLENGALRFREWHDFGSDLGLIGLVGGPWQEVG